MDSHTDSNPQLYYPRLAPTCSTTPHSDEQANPVAPSTSQQLPDATGERVSEPPSSGSAPADNQTTPNEYCEGNCEPVLSLSELPADIFDEQAGELNREGMRLMTDQNNLPSVPTTRSLEEVMVLAEQGESLVQRYNNSGTLAELDEGISTLREANVCLPQNHPMKVAFLNVLRSSLLRRFERLGGTADVDETITAQQQAVRLTPDGHPDKPGCLNNLGIAFQSRFERLGDLADVHEAITVQRQAVRHTPDSHPGKARRLNNLGISLLCRFQRLGDLDDVQEAIATQQQAVRLTPDGHPEKPRCLNNLGSSLLYRFDRLGKLTDVDEAITAHRQAIRLTPDSHPDKRRFLMNLGGTLQSRFGRLSDVADIDEAITVKQQAIRLIPVGHVDKPQCLNNLGNSFQSRFQRLGDLADVHEAITAHQQAVHLTPDGHAAKPQYLMNLGGSFQSRFERFGDVADVDEAITAKQQAIRLTPVGHPDKPRYLNYIGNSFQRRFERLGDLADVHEAIATQQQAIRLVPHDHPDKPGCLNNLGISFLSRFQRLGELSDLHEAITAQQQAVQLTPNGHPDKPGHLTNLGTSFRSRFKRLSNIADVHEAIMMMQQAVRLTPVSHPDMPRHLNNLGNSFRNRFEHLSDLVDVDEAITAHQRAVHLTPDGHPHKPQYLNNLANSFLGRFTRQSNDATLAQATDILSRSAKSSSGSPSVRFDAARQWGTLCFSVKSSRTLEAHATLMDLIPHVVWLGRTVEQRHKAVSNIGNVMADAVAAAFHFGKLPLALEWMEQGRSIVWGQMLRLRSPLDELRLQHPDEANSLERISRGLDLAAVAYSNLSDSSSDGVSRSLEEEARAHRRLAEEYDRTLMRIRELAGFSEFLRPEKSKSLCSAATSGPVIIINVHTTRCDALILLPHSSQVSHVPLPGFHLSIMQRMPGLPRLMQRADTIQRHYDSDGVIDTELPDALGSLWCYMVQPILSHLKLLRKSAHGDLPHITWCVTGPLAFLPIHVAGLYTTKDQLKISDCVVSSYTPTLAALLNAKRHHEKSNTARLLIVSQPATLPGTVKEANIIKSLPTRTSHRDIVHLDDHDATVAAVLQNMKECSWIHLACHGIQDPVNPNDSAFVLSDDRLTLKEIMRQSFSHTELAFLSACQTAMGDSELPGEAIHLAAGMLMAGYGSVVATMWSIDDNDAPIVAEKFYKYLIEEAGGESGRAAYALHAAIAHLAKVRGENNLGRWAPFIHLGTCSPSRPPPVPE